MEPSKIEIVFSVTEKIKIMRIKNYIDFINESKHHEFGCVMLEVPVSNWNEITSSIDTSDIYTKRKLWSLQKIRILLIALVWIIV
jgi:hypothetical protein